MSAQEAPLPRGIVLTPTIDTVISYSDLAGNPTGDGSEGFVLQVRPGLSLTSRGRRVVGSLSYALGLIYRQDKNHRTDHENTLAAALTAEAVENWAFIDFRASVSQQALSAFGRQSVAGSLQSSDNRAEVGSLSLSPYVRGVFGDVAAYEVRLSAAATNTRRSIEGDSTSTGGTVSVTSLPRGAVLGWGLEASSQKVDFRAGRLTDDERVTASVTASPDPELRLAVRAGSETTNISSVDAQRSSTWGASAAWNPSPRTNASLDSDRRFFGNSHRFVFEHRMPRSSIRYSSLADATTGAQFTGVGAPVTLYELLFNQLASIQPDPALRDLQVRESLRLSGQDPNATVPGGFATGAVSKQHRQDLALSYLGVRTTLTLLGFASTLRTLDPLVLAGADTSVRQLGYTSTLAYRLTPQSVVTLTGARQKTLSNATTPGNDLKSLSLAWSEQLGMRTTAIFGGRYVVFNSTTDPYRETAITASLSMRF